MSKSKKPSPAPKKSTKKSKAPAMTLGEKIAAAADREGMSEAAVVSFPDFVLAYGLEGATDADILQAEGINRSRSRAITKGLAERNAAVLKKREVAPEEPEESEAAPKPKKKSKAVSSDPTAPEKAPKAKPAAPVKSKVLWEGFAPTAVIRWMGKEGWSLEHSMAAIAGVGIHLADATFKIQWKAGQKGERGEPAAITPALAKKLKAARSKK